MQVSRIISCTITWIPTYKLNIKISRNDLLHKSNYYWNKMTEYGIIFPSFSLQFPMNTSISFVSFIGGSHSIATSSLLNYMNHIANGKASTFKDIFRTFFMLKQNTSRPTPKKTQTYTTIKITWMHLTEDTNCFWICFCVLNTFKKLICIKMGGLIILPNYICLKSHFSSLMYFRWNPSKIKNCALSLLKNHVHASMRERIHRHTQTRACARQYLATEMALSITCVRIIPNL
jgi:hypothetical protein